MIKALLYSSLIAGFLFGVKTIHGQNPVTLVDENTYIKVCFWAQHSYVSDLGFYLKAPGCELLEPGDVGVVQLCPAASDWGPSAAQGSWTGIPWSALGCSSAADENTPCNSGNNIGNESSGFCFSTHIVPNGQEMVAGTPEYTPCVCDLPAPISGTFASVGTWEPIYGFDINEEGWRVQIYDCESADIGNLQRATIQFSNYSECDSTVVMYELNNINLPINDGSCNAISASQNIIPFSDSDIYGFEEEFPIICGVNINENDNSEIFWNSFSSEIIDSVIIYDANLQGGEMIRIGAVKFSELSSFVDTSSVPEQRAFEYNIGFKNTCGNINLVSLVQKSICLSLSSSENLIALEWNENESFSDDSVSIYRGNSPDDMHLIEKVLYSDLTYIDSYVTENDSLFYKLSFETHLCDQDKEIIAINSNILGVNIEDFVRLKPIQNENEIIIVPNPAKDYINIDLNGINADKLEIYDITGKLLIEKTLVTENQTLNIEILGSGVYFIIVWDESKYVGKLNFVKR